MHNLYIVGAGAQGRVAYGQLMHDLERDVHWKICGFLDDRQTALDGYGIPLEIVGDAFTHIPKEGDVFICAVGNPVQRRHYAAQLIAKGAKFMNVFTEIYAGSNLKLGEGVFFERNVRIGPDCTIGNFAIVNSTSILGHDISVGDYSQIGSFVFVGGGAQIGEGVTIYAHACILPGIKIGDNSVIGAGSVVVRDVPANVTMFGNPAKRLAGSLVD